MRLIFTLSLAIQLSGVLWAQPAYPAAKHGGNYMHNFYFPPAPSSTPWAPSWSPDGQSIAFSMHGSIWIMDIQTRVARQLTHNSSYHSLPDWSPDGNWIVYTADDGGNTIQLEVADVATGTSHALTSDEWIYVDPVFSPDGSQLAYVSTRPSGYFNVYIRAIEGAGWDGPEIPITSDNEYPSNRLYFGPHDMHITPDWFPGGEELLLVSNRDTPLGSGNVWRVPAKRNGFEQRRVVLQEQTLYRTHPEVSIDGKRFVYSSTRGAADQFNNLYVLPSLGGEPYKLTHFSHDAFAPTWSPDGEWIAYVDNREGLHQLALLETYGGRVRELRPSSLEWKVATGRISVRIVSDGKPIAARVHLEASDGKFYAPGDAYARISAAGDPVFHTPGQSQIEVPAGPASITIAKGFEWIPQTVELTVPEGRRHVVVVLLHRLTDVSAQGWFSGSTHVHMNYGGNLHNTLENLMFMSDAEDQDIVNEQIANKDNRILDYQHFIAGGGAHPLSTAERVLVVGQEYRPPFYGHVFMLGLHDHLISPFTTGYEGTAIESLYPSNTDMLRKAKAQGATVGYVHAFPGNDDPLQGTLGGGKGYIVDAALDETHALEWSWASKAGFYPWYATLNNGLRVTAVGGEDSISNLHRSKLVGSVRTYVYTGGDTPDMEAWFQGLRNGHAFVSTGPLIDFKVSGKMAGEEIRLSEPGKVEVDLKVDSIVPLKTAEIVQDGQVVRSLEFTGEGKRMRFRGTVPVTKSGWIHVRVEGAPEERAPLDAAYAQAFTNPVWILVADKPVRSGESARYCLDWIDKLREMAEAWPGWRSQREKEHVFGQFEEARRIYSDFERQARQR